MQVLMGMVVFMFGADLGAQAYIPNCVSTKLGYHSTQHGDWCGGVSCSNGWREVTVQESCFLFVCGCSQEACSREICNSCASGYYTSGLSWGYATSCTRCNRITGCTSMETCSSATSSQCSSCSDGRYLHQGAAKCPSCSPVQNCRSGMVTCTTAHDSICSQCDTGYGGGSCDDLNECALETHKCDERATCMNTDGSFSCLCSTGWESSDGGLTCTDANECSNHWNNCADGKATCFNTVGSFNCQCTRGWESTDGGVTCNDVDECSRGSHTCTWQHASCINTHGSFMCGCDPGWVLNPGGGSCTDIDECTANSHNCAAGRATCTSTVGSFTCECVRGWESSDGGVTCTDINECTLGSHNCAERTATCINTVGSFTCECSPGWESSDGGVTCMDVNECSLSLHNCDSSLSLATCTNTVGSFSCACNAGWESSNGGVTCSDADECSQASHNCDVQHAACANAVGSFSCVCATGFESERGLVVGTACQNVDECAVSDHNCDTTAQCEDSTGSFECHCISGWLSNNEGVSCFPPELGPWGVELQLLLEYRFTASTQLAFRQSVASSTGSTTAEIFIMEIVHVRMSARKLLENSTGSTSGVRVATEIAAQNKDEAEALASSEKLLISSLNANLVAFGLGEATMVAAPSVKRNRDDPDQVPIWAVAVCVVLGAACTGTGLACLLRHRPCTRGTPVASGPSSVERYGRVPSPEHVGCTAPTEFTAVQEEGLPSAPPPVWLEGVKGHVRLFRYATMAEATKNFASARELGSGGFGKVFRADGAPLGFSSSEFAVKRLDHDSSQGVDEFQNEIRVLGGCQHESLLPLIGFSNDNMSPLCLVFPLMRGGSVQDCLFPEGGTASLLTWEERVQISLCVAEALLYLHTPTSSKGIIYHRDIKPANILLGDGLVRLADAGLAKMHHGDRTHVTSTKLGGTFGFFDPEFSKTGHYNKAADAYSLGITILMLLTGWRALEPPGKTIFERCIGKQADQVADKGAQWPSEASATMLRVGLGLTQLEPYNRMTLTDVLAVLRTVGLAAAKPISSASLREEEPSAPIIHECAMCMSEPKVARLGCGHAAYCRSCLKEVLSRTGPICPYCRTVINCKRIKISDSIANQDTFVGAARHEGSSYI